ncbi:MAG: YraN family protein [Rhodospirillaceae bacterium]|nr:YraN family protein [Rhodospirillaceae bacterium]
MGDDGRAAARAARGKAADARGRWAERLCLARLVATGWRIVGRRVTVGRGSGAGEIDIVARRGRTLSFIEVKARAEERDALAAVGADQRARLVRAAEAFIARHPALAGLDIRFDVMTVGGARGGLAWPRHHADAWRP